MVSIATNWAIIAAAFALVAAWPNPLTVVAALFLIGARQLGLAVLMHEASHRSLLRDKRWNDLVGNWLCAYPSGPISTPTAPYHLQHHAKTWTKDDPDLGLVLPFPITPASLRRKFWRDLSGQTGRKFARGAWKRSIARWRAGDEHAATRLRRLPRDERACSSRCSPRSAIRCSTCSGSAPGSRPTRW